MSKRIRWRYRGWAGRQIAWQARSDTPAVSPGSDCMWTWLHKLGSPPRFYRLTGQLLPWFAGLAAVCILAGLYGGLWLAPPDYQQGDSFRIIYVQDRKSTRLNSSHVKISYAVFCLKKKKKK